MTPFFQKIKRFTTRSKKKEAAPAPSFTQLLNNNGVEIIETAADGNCFYDAFYRSILTIEDAGLKNRIFDPILDTLKNEDMPTNLRLDDRSNVSKDNRKDVIKTINLGAFTNASHVISQNYNESAKAQGQARLFKECQTLFIRCCRRFVADKLTPDSLSMINQALCAPDVYKDVYKDVYQSSIKPFLHEILQCPYSETTTITERQLTAYKNAVKMIKGGRVDFKKTKDDTQRLNLDSPVWAGQPEMRILQEELNIKLLNFKLNEQNNLTSTFQTLEGANINKETVYVPLAYDGFHFQTLALKTCGAEGITYQSASSFDTLPPVLQMLDCFQFKGLVDAPSRNECLMYTKIKDILDLNKQIPASVGANYDYIVSNSLKRIIQGYQQFQTNIGILSWTEQLEILNQLLPFFTKCSRLKSEADLKACQVNDGKPYSDTRASILAIVDESSIGNDMKTITSYVKNQIINVNRDNFGNIIAKLDGLYDTLYPHEVGSSPSIFPQDSPLPDQPPADNAESVIAFITDSINTKIIELRQNIEKKKPVPNNPVKDTLNSIESVEEREQREEQERIAAEEAQAEFAKTVAKQAKAEKAAEKEAAKKEAAKKEAAEKAAADKAAAEAKEIKAAISPLQKIAKDQLNQLNNLIKEWKQNENEWKAAKKMLEKYNLKEEDESNWLMEKVAEEKKYLEEEVDKSKLVSSGSKEKKKQITNEEKAERSRITKELKEYRNFNNANIKYSNAYKDLERVALQFFTLRENKELSIIKINAALDIIRTRFTKSKPEGGTEEESSTKVAQPELPTTADLYKTFQDRIEKLADPFVPDLFKRQDLNKDGVLDEFAETYSPKSSNIDELKNFNAEIRSLLLKITLDPYANVHQEQLNLLTDKSLDSQERYAISNEINRTTQSIIAPYLEPPKGTISLSMTAKPEKAKAGGGKRRRKNSATRRSNAQKARKPNSARGNRSGTRRRGRFARSRSLPRRKLAGNRDRSQKVCSKPNQRTRRPQRK